VVPGFEQPPPEGQNTYPGVHGSTNWMSPSYDPTSRLFYIAAREEGTVYYHATADFHEGTYYTAGGIRGIANVEPSGSIKALDPSTGEQKWEFPLHSPPWAGVLSTAGGLLFGGTTEGNVFALDSSTGKPLWDFQAGAAVASGAMSYEFEGKQYVVITAGRTLIAFGLE
jgi:alcohol dehydrogenase (cytochrome c)